MQSNVEQRVSIAKHLISENYQGNTKFRHKPSLKTNLVSKSKKLSEVHILINSFYGK